MTTTAAKVVAGTGKPNGYIYRAPLGSTLPTSESTTLAGPYVSQGYASSDGLTRSIAKAYEITRDWNGDEVKRSKTETSVTLTFTLIEASNGEVAKSVFGESAVTITPATSSAGGKIAVAFGGEDAPPSVWVFELKDGNAIRRVVCPIAQNVTEDFEQEFVNSGVISYPVTLSLTKDSNGKFFYDYADDGIKTA